MLDGEKAHGNRCHRERDLRGNNSELLIYVYDVFQAETWRLQRTSILNVAMF